MAAKPVASPVPEGQEISPVEEVRAVREALSARFGQDIDRLADHASEVAAPLREKLGLRTVTPPPAVQ